MTGFYESEARAMWSNGPIKYRFMLGKRREKLRCRAQLPLQGDAEIQRQYQRLLWHIDYREEPDSWDVPNPWYVSYLYNHQSKYPLQNTLPRMATS